jgi:hypothetical protein
MANSFDSNVTRKLMRVFLEKFEANRVHSKNVNTQLLSGAFNPSSGTTVDFKRPTDYVSVRTADGNITGSFGSIITGKATGTVQNYFTVPLEFTQVDQALKMDQLDELLAPAARRMVTDLELDFTSFMMKNSGLLAGTPGTAATTWDHVAEGGSVLKSAGVPEDMPWYYTVNPYTQAKLASNQRSLGAGGSAAPLITEAHEKATISQRFAGFDRVMTATTLPSYTTFNNSDRAGTLSAAPTPTYLAHKDTMVQSLTVANFPANMTINAGEVLQVAAINRLNLATRTPVLDETGASVLFTGVVNADVTLSGTGTGTVTITGPGIFEAGGAYNTIDAAIPNGAVVTLLGAHNTRIQPNLFWHKNAFSIGSVPLPKLYATDTLGTTEDGIQVRITRFADGITNKQMVRFDMLPAYATLNPFMAGQGFG